MATRENARWKNKRRKSLYNKEDTRNNFIYRSSSPSPPAEPPAPAPSLDPPLLSPPLPPPELSINDPSKPFPSPPIAPPTPFQGPINDLLKPVIPCTPLIAPPSLFRTIEVDDQPRPSSPLIAPPTPFRLVQVNDPPRRNKRKKRKIDDEEPSKEKDLSIYLDVNKICRMEIDKLEKIQNEILTGSDKDCILQANEEMKQSNRFDKETQERINDSIRKRIDSIEMHVKRKKEMLLCTQEALTPRAIIHKLSAHASKVINTPSLTHK